jgi:hypothetical protein
MLIPDATSSTGGDLQPRRPGVDGSLGQRGAQEWLCSWKELGSVVSVRWKEMRR